MKNRKPFNKLSESKGKRSLAVAKAAKPLRDKTKHDASRIWILAGIAVLTVIVYSKAIGNGFTNWDDDEYIITNPLLHSFNLKAIFTHYLSGNYHPITELLLAIEYHLWGLKESGYHCVSLLLHICNAFFVFYAILILSKKREVAIVASLLFAIHPMHVESVAWAAELKDLLYTFFFLASYLCYLKYITEDKRKFYLFSLLLFLFSLLSKAMAASLPVVLILTDYFMSRKFTVKTLLEKAPFFSLSLIFGIVAVFAQRSVGGIQEVAVFPLYQRAIFACYGFIAYLYKLVLPLDLSAFYPFPIKTSAGIPSWYYLFPVILLLLVSFVFYSTRFSRKLFFGIGFFAITVFLVLQLLPVGFAVIADRYSYIPSIGIFYLAGEGFYWLWTKKAKDNIFKPAAIGFLILFGVFFSFTTYARCEIWKSGMTLWNDMISKCQVIPFAYNNRGILFLNDKKYDEAMDDFNKAIKLQPRYPHALNNRGIIYSNQKKYDEAKNNFDKAIEYQSDYDEAYTNRGIMLNDEGKYPEAINDFNKVIELQPNSPQAFYSRARAEYALGKKDTACMDLQQAIQLKFPAAEDAYNHLCH